MQKTLEIQALTNGAAAIARDDTGKACFVTGAAPGDTVIAQIDQEKARFSTAHVVEVLEPGSCRVSPACPAAQVCGGCSWQHIDYDTQLTAKRRNVVDALIRIGSVDEQRAESLVGECIGSKRRMGYRNKLELGVGAADGGKLMLGFHREKGALVETPDTCPLAHGAIEKAPKALRGALRYLQGSGDLGIYRIGIRNSIRTKSTEIALWTPPGSFPRAAAAKVIGSALNATSIVRVMADPGKQRAIKGVEVLSGKGFWEEQLHGFTYRISAPSFFQVNTAQAETLIDIVLEGLDLNEGSRVADLYCGAGTFTLPLAQVATSVFGVESAGSSVRDLRRNADDNGAYIDVIGGDSARELPNLGSLDALVVDPPRSGLADGVAQSIAAANPSRIAYVSCNATTWARDVERLEACGYELYSATPVDLFPQTHHCEVASIFHASCVS